MAIVVSRVATLHTYFKTPFKLVLFFPSTELHIYTVLYCILERNLLQFNVLNSVLFDPICCIRSNYKSDFGNR